MPANRPPLLLCLLLAAAAVGCHGSGSDAPAGRGGPRGQGPAKKEADAIAVRTAPAEQRTLSELWSTSATLRPEQEATITARTAGVIERLAAEEGDWVRAGQVLAVLEDDELAIALEKARIADETSQAEYQRAKELHRKGLLADEAYELKEREARDSVNARELAKLNLSRTVVKAPFAGRILRRHEDVGATVSNGTPVYDLADLSPLHADVNVPEPQVARMRAGQEARVASDAGAMETPGRIERIAPLVNPETGTVKVTVAVDPQEGLRPGSFVRVAIVTGVHEDAVVVPRSALVAEGRRWHLFALAPDGEHVERLAVSPGFEEKGDVEVLGPEGGPSPLEPGREVVVLGAPALSDGARVKVASDSAGAVADSAAGDGSGERS